MDGEDNQGSVGEDSGTKADEGGGHQSGVGISKCGETQEAPGPETRVPKQAAYRLAVFAICPHCSKTIVQADPRIVIAASRGHQFGGPCPDCKGIVHMHPDIPEQKPLIQRATQMPKGPLIT